ncbi:CheR family methyltransferase [Marinobacter adhaerens]|jgi:chemotaxis protein methyltransferase CheR|uniref:CheR family methyltransferase n=1 Tax=Marinobacter adhaerens TaxID=1033846 RepID=UPI001E3C38AC|nr:protein-glutamate O-methyltransferase CheR [Marinobacter adhaerens]MCD1646498.1 protein-glutamate O-methyltransferase CheR [Marinobacter adhaerens]
MLKGEGIAGSPELTQEDFRALRRIMQSASGIELPDEKRYLIIHRLGKRLRAHGLPNFGDYLLLVRRDPLERQTLVDLLTTNETWFFREPGHFDWLGRVCREKRGGLRVWSAASSTGEEGFSIAMTLAENSLTRNWEVLGTDVSHSVVERANTGLFSAKALDSIPREYLKKYWLKGVGEQEGYIMAKPELRERVSFRVANLNERLPTTVGSFDVAFLRNVLIYFTTEGKQRLVRNVLERVKTGGLLMVGHSESLFGLDLPLKQLAPAVYQKVHSGPAEIN